MSDDANTVIKQAAIDWFGADWRRAAGFGGYVIQQLGAAGYSLLRSVTLEEEAANQW